MHIFKIISFVYLQKQSQGYCSAVSLLLIYCFAYNQARLQNNWQDVSSACRCYWNAFNSQNEAETSLLIYCVLCSEKTNISVAEIIEWKD